MPKAIVVGSINMDIVAFVDRHPKVGETIFGNDLKYFPGGKGSNQAVSCRRLGCDTLMVGCVGKDGFGKEMLKFQQKEGVDVSGVVQLNHSSTGIALITVSSNSENSIIVISGANSNWDNGFIKRLEIQKDDIALAQFEVPDWVIIESFQKAKSCGAKTILNPAPVRRCKEAIISTTDILVVNEIELQEISGLEVNPNNDDSVFASAERLVEMGFKSIVVTLGKRGVRLLSDGQKNRINARVVKPVDTTGAGDCFIGGLTSGLLSGTNLYDSAELGNVAASISITREGAASSLPTLEEVDKIFGETNEN